MSVVALTAGGAAVAQPGAAPAFAPPRSARESAQVDLTGYWVALVTEDWLWRMITPPPGDATSVPLNPEGRRVAAEWDPARDVASGEACRPFGAAGLMRLPLRLHITWQDENTLKIETDAGEQTRLLHFGSAATPPAEKSWQGFTTAEWTHPVGGFDLKAVLSGRPPAPPDGPPKGSLKAVTTHLRAGYLRKNGVPYSENAVLTEFFSRVSAFGNDYLTVLSIVHDPMYLNSDFVTSSHFKREPDDSNWSPSPCRTAPPLATRGE
ncbi:MAG TPA: hypothetical protein VF322_15565 [Gammaproteobacteria bacterium]